MAEENKKFIEPKSPFDDVEMSHIVLDALRESGHDSRDPEKFLKRLRHVDYGLTAQIECAATLAWLGNSVLVHELGQDGYNSPQLGDILVPDLFAVFCRNNKHLRVLIEVKSTDELCIPWTKEYRDKLAKYSDIFEAPVLLAWRPRQFGEWILVDGLSEEIVTDNKIHFENAFMNNLMGVIAGDFRVDPKPGIGINFIGQIIGEKEPTEKGYMVNIKITEAFWGKTDGEKFKKLNGSSTALILTTASEHYYREETGQVLWGYLTPEFPQGGCHSVTAQNLLRILVSWAKKDNERIAWRHVLGDLQRIKSKSQMEDELRQDIGRTVRYIMNIRPKTLPSFLPKEWIKK